MYIYIYTHCVHDDDDDDDDGDDGDDDDDDDDDDAHIYVQHNIKWLLVWPKPCNEGATNGDAPDKTMDINAANVEILVS